MRERRMERARMQRENVTERKARPSTSGEEVCVIDKAPRGSLRELYMYL